MINEHLIKAIMQQADHEDLKTLGFPNWKNWIQKTILIWFGRGGILAEYVEFDFFCFIPDQFTF